MNRFLYSTVAALLMTFSAMTAHAAGDDGIAVDKEAYANRQTLPDFTAAACPDTPHGLEQIKGNLYRHTTGAGLAVHSGLVLITKEGALVIDPAMTCTAGWLEHFNIEIALADKMLWPCGTQCSKAHEISVGGLCSPLSGNLKA